MLLKELLDAEQIVYSGPMLLVIPDRQADNSTWNSQQGNSIAEEVKVLENEEQSQSIATRT
jgi:hypothetical protein